MNDNRGRWWTTTVTQRCLSVAALVAAGGLLNSQGYKPSLAPGKMTVPAGFDPSAIRLIGNLTGQPPFTGTVRHRGWRAKEIKVPPPPPLVDVGSNEMKKS